MRVLVGVANTTELRFVTLLVLVLHARIPDRDNQPPTIRISLQSNADKGAVCAAVVTARLCSSVINSDAGIRRMRYGSAQFTF